MFNYTRKVLQQCSFPPWTQPNSANATTMDVVSQASPFTAPPDGASPLLAAE